MDSTALSPAHHGVELCFPYGGACWWLLAFGRPLGVGTCLIVRVSPGGAYCGVFDLCGKLRVAAGGLARVIPEELPWYVELCPRF